MVRSLPREPPRYADRTWKGRDSVSHAQVLALVAAVCAAAWLLYRLTRWAGRAGATPGENIHDTALMPGARAATGPAPTGGPAAATGPAPTTGTATPRGCGCRRAGAAPGDAGSLPDAAGDRRRNVSAAARCARLDAGGPSRPATVWRAAEFRLANSRM